MACIKKRHYDSGEWRYALDYYDHQGKRRLKTLPKDTSKADAKKALRDIEDKIDKGIYIPQKNLPLFSVVAEMWLESKKPNIRHSTYKQYKGHLENHLNPFYEGKRINRINYDEIEFFISHCLDSNITI